MKTRNTFFSVYLMSALVFGTLVGVSASSKKVYRYGDYISELDAYYAQEIDDPAGLVKAKKYLTPTDSSYSTQKKYSLDQSLIGDIESVWDSYTGKGTTVAIIDDGFDYEHPEYVRSDGTSAILSTSRYYYANSSYTAALYKNYSEDPTCIGEDWEVDSTNSSNSAWATHGTNTSTTAAAPINNVGGVGIAPDANILALKIDMSFVAIKAAISYAIDQKVDVINMSLGAYAENFTDGWGDSQTGSSSTATYLNSVCKEAYDAGIIVVAAAGNESTFHKSYPACNTKVIGVGAIGDWDNKGNPDVLAEFTNYVKAGETGEINVDILAPGYVYTATKSGTQSSPKHTYSGTQGTSFSSPIVAGAACLWKQKYPSGTPDQFLEQLQASADGIGSYTNQMIPVSGWYSSLSDVGPSNITNGRINVASLLEADKPFVTTVQNALSISVGEKKQIDLQTSNGSITYSSSNDKIATVTSSGLVEGTGAGDAVITVTATKNGESATATVNVHVAEVVASTSISFNPSSITLTVGETYDAESTITVNPNNASRIFLFESNDEAVASVDIDTGLVTALSEGTATITAVAGYGEGSDELSVTVEKATEPSGWTKVTTSEVPDGDYLIVYETGGVAFDGSLTTLDAVSNTISVSITNNNIPYSTETYNSRFTISSGTIKSASGYFIGNTSNSNALSSSTTDAYTNTISISSGDAEIKSSGGAYLRYNAASDQARFRYYKSSSYASQKAIQLYKLSTDGTSTPSVSEVTISPSALALDIYSNPSSTLTATVTGTNNPSQAVNWTSNNTSVATVDSTGAVTAVGVGSTTIKATSVADSSKYATCIITVTDSTPKTLSSISISGQNTSFKVGDTFTFGGTVTAYFSDSSSSDVTSSATFSGYNMSIEGTQTVTVSYTYGGTTKTTSYSITVSSGSTVVEGTQTVEYVVNSSSEASLSSGTAPEGSAITFKNTYSTKDQMTKGNSQTWTWKGYEGTTISSIKVEMRRNSSSGYGSLALTNNESSISLGKTIGSTSELTSTYKYYEILSSSFECTGDITLVITASANSIYCDKVSITYETIDTSDKIISSLSASYSGGSIYVGGTLDTSKVVVTATYTDSVKYPEETLSSSTYTLSGFDSSSSGEKNVTVTYTGSLSVSSSPMTTSFTVSVINDNVKEVVLSCSKIYHPGETIAKEDVTATLVYDSGKTETTTEFVLANEGYQFTYEDAPSGGVNGTKELTATYNGNSYNVSVNVSRIEHQTISDETITLSSSNFSASGISTSSSNTTTGKVNIGDIEFNVTNAYVYTLSNNSTSFLSFGKTAGEISNANAFESDITSLSVSIRSGSRTDGVISISKNGTDWVTYSDSEVQTGGYRYFKIAYTSTNTSTYSNISGISFTLMGTDNPTNVANYIMFEDNNGQCTSKLDVALSYLNSMSSADKSKFWTSNDYVISTARERLQAWSIHEGKTLTFNEETNTFNSILVAKNNLSIHFDNQLIFIAITVLAIGSSIGGYFLIKRRKEN